jgi:hypothetical protein
VAWPDWYWYPGLYAVAPGISFGIGFGIGAYGGVGWGWHHWGADWHAHRIDFDRGAYVSHSRTFIGPNHFYRGGPGFRGQPAFRGSPPVFRGPEAPHFQPGMRSGAFSGFDHGGMTRSFAARGALSAGGRSGGGAHAPGGGFHGGGGHR